MIDYNGEVLPLCPWLAVHFSSPILLNLKNYNRRVKWPCTRLCWTAARDVPVGKAGRYSYQTHASLVGMVYWAITVRCAYAQILLSIDLSCTERLKVTAKHRPKDKVCRVTARHWQDACRAPHRSGLLVVRDGMTWQSIGRFGAHQSPSPHLVQVPLSVIWHGSELTWPRPSSSFLSQ